MADSGQYSDSWARLISKKILRKHYALVPTLVTCACACSLTASYITYMLLTKPDLSFRPWAYGTDAPYQEVAPTEIRKMWDMHNAKGIERNAEIEALRRELGSYYMKQN